MVVVLSIYFFSLGFTAFPGRDLDEQRIRFVTSGTQTLRHGNLVIEPKLI